jgi:predicted nuclease with TOPRIM domain
MSKFKKHLIIFCALFSISFLVTTIKRANDFEQKYLELRVELNNANNSKAELIESQKEAILNQYDLSQKLAVLNAKNAVLNKHYDALKGTYKCDRPTDAEQVIMQGICDYAEATGGGCK